jgi:hypothetical protein
VICVACGMLRSVGSPELCDWHGSSIGSSLMDCNKDWAKANKIWNDYFHRGAVIPLVDEDIISSRVPAHED